MIKFIKKPAREIVLAMLMLVSICVNAQIGYQVSLLNTATGEPRANESVNVIVKITDSDGKVICEENKKETTNDFGVLSMTVGNSDTFTEADWSKLPFFIEATVDDRLIGRSQILSVPVAEHAKHTGSLSKELLCSKTWKASWGGSGSQEISFKEDGTFVYKYIGESYLRNYTGTYEIDGNFLTLYYYDDDDGYQADLYKYSEILNCLGKAYGSYRFI